MSRARGIPHPVRRAVADRFGGPVVDQLPVNSIRAAGHAHAAALAFVKWITARAGVLEVDVEEAHFVAAQRIGIAIVAMYAEKLVVIGKSFGAFGPGFFVKKEIGFLAVDEDQIERGLAPADAIVALGIADAHAGFVPDAIFVAVADHRAVDGGKLFFPAFGRPDQ